MTVSERVAKLEATIVGDGGKGLYEIEDEHYKDFKEFKKKFYAWVENGRKESCYYMTDKKRKRESLLVLVGVVGLWATTIALAVNAIVAIVGWSAL